MVCHCWAVDESSIRRLVEMGTDDISRIQQMTRAGTDCGACCDLVAEIMTSERRLRLRRFARPLLETPLRSDR